MMTNSGRLIPSIIDFDTDAKFTISTNPDNEENWWSQYYDSLICYLHSTDPDEADRADCFVILETNSRDEIAEILNKNCKYENPSEGYELLQLLHGNGEHVPNNRTWVDSEWDKQTRASGKYLMGTPMNLEDLVPTDKKSARILKRVARFHFEDHDPCYIRIMGHCAKFL